jgi:hypothetical protein
MTNDQLRLRLLRVEADVRELKAALAAPSSGCSTNGATCGKPPKPKRPAVGRPADAIVAARVSLWDQLTLLHPTSKQAFCVKHHLGDPSDFCRFFSSKDARGIREGSTTAERYYRALHDASAEARARKLCGQPQGFHGKMAAFQDSTTRPQ